eukprot:Pgem_evm1s3429
MFHINILATFYFILMVSNSKGENPLNCHTVKTAADDCFKDVIWAKQTGIFNRDQYKYPSYLTADSSLADFQKYLFSRGQCKTPPCETDVSKKVSKVSNTTKSPEMIVETFSFPTNYLDVGETKHAAPSASGWIHSLTPLPIAV